ncbi:MAG: MFS transporter [Aureispira sp.]
MATSKLILPIIVLSQFFCTSLWFAGNGVMEDLRLNFGLQESDLGHLTAVVQFGFIIGTLIFAIFSLADRYAPSKVFCCCALLGATFNLGVIWEGNSFASILMLRFLTGFFLAGIYPVGMKIAADYYEKGLGKSLGFLVGALVVGTAFPHLLKEITDSLSWELVLLVTSFLAVLGGLLMLGLVPDGPNRQPSKAIQLSAFFSIFRGRDFRTAALGYFGHMWELYAFWAFVPVLLTTYTQLHPSIVFNIPLLTFFIIGVGGLACIGSGYLAQVRGTKWTACLMLLLSCGCCLLSPLVFALESASLFLGFLLFWGMVVVADSPLFSTLVAQNAPLELKGTALTIVNCIGFSVTIISIQLINIIRTLTDSNSIYMILALGPVLGLMALLIHKEPPTSSTK